MKKLLIIILSLLSIHSIAQTYVGTGTANLQRAPTAKGYIYRNNMGALGNVYWYTQQQIDSLFGVFGGVYVPTSRTLTFNGTSFDLSNNRAWNVGTVTSVTATGTNGILITGSPITTFGTFGFQADTTLLVNKTYFNTKIGTSVSNYLALKAPLLSPALTGIPTAPTAPLGTNTDQIATMAAIQAAIAGSGAGSVSTVSVVTANGVSGTVANPTTTPAITLSLGAITPTSVNGTTATEIGYVTGVTSSIQTQLNGKQATIGYTPENAANKTATASTSTTTYPNWLGVENYIASFGYGTGTVTNFSKTDGFGISSTVTNPATTPNYSAHVDTTAIESRTNFNTTIGTATATALAGKQPTIGYTPENVANKATTFTTLNNTLYPSTQAVSNYMSSNYVPLTRTLTINGTTQDLSTNRTWTVTAATPNSLTNGYGILSLSFNGSAAQQVVADTASSTGLVSKTRLSNALTGGYVPYLGATKHVNLGLFDIYANKGNFTVESRVGDTLSGTNAAFYTNRTITNSTTNYRGFRTNDHFSTTNGSAYANFDAQSFTAGTGNLDHFVGFQSRPVHGSSGTLNALSAFTSLLEQDGGNITDAYEFVSNTISGAGTITNYHGLYIAPQTLGTNQYGISSNITAGSNRWNMYVAGDAPNYFKANVGINTTTPSATLGGVNQTINSNSGFASVVLQSSGVDKAFFTTDGTSNILGAFAGGILQFNTNGIGQLIIGSTGGVTATSLATGGATEMVTTSSAGVLSHSPIPVSGFANPMTAAGDLIVGGSSGTATRLAANTGSTKFLTESGSVSSWTDLFGGTNAWTGNNNFSAGTIFQGATTVSYANGLGYVAGNSNHVDIKAPATVASTFSLTLPNALPGAQSAMQVDASGNLFFSNSFPFILLGSAPSAGVEYVYSGINSQASLISSNAATAQQAFILPDAGGLAVVENVDTVQVTGRTTVLSTSTTIGKSGMYQVSVNMNINSISVDVMKASISWTDENNNAQTADFYSQGATSPNQLATGPSRYAPMVIYCKTGTNLTYSTTLVTSGGSINYDFYGRAIHL